MSNLVQCDISHREPESHHARIEIFADVAVVRVNQPKLTAFENNAGGRKLPITEFSRKSKLNLQRKVATIRNRERPLWLTFTYPDEAWFGGEVSAARAKRDLDALLKRFSRYDDQTGWAWKMETKRRKSGDHIGEIAPHFHILMTGNLHDLAELRRVYRQFWQEIIYNGREVIKRPRVDVQALQSWRQVVAYIAEYMSKGETEIVNGKPVECYKILTSGRWWGIGGNLTMRLVATVALSEVQTVELRRAVAGWMKSRSRKYAKRLKRGSSNRGFTVFGLGDLSSPGYGWRSDSQYQAIFRLLDFIGAD